MLGFDRSRHASARGRWTTVWSGALLAGLCFGAARATADTLILYNGQNPDNTTQTGPAPFAANTVAPGVIANGLTTHTGINNFVVGTTAGDHASTPLYQLQSKTDVDNTLADDGPGSPQQTTALTNKSYFDFTLSAPGPFQKLQLSSISFSVGQGTSSNTQERGYALYWDVGGFTTASQALIADAKIDGYRENSGGTWTTPTISLGDVEVTSINFRFYVFVGDGAGTGSNIEFDDIRVNGAVVPEPASIGLMSVPVLTLFARRRRRLA